MHKGGIAFSGVNGTLTIENDFWQPSFTGTYGKSDFAITGSGLNVLSFLIDRQETLLASASFRAGMLAVAPPGDPGSASG